MSEDNSKYFATAVDYVTPSYYPLVVQGDGWSIHIQEKPVKRIFRSGKMPTRDDLIDAFSATYWPVIMIPILEIIAATCEAEE